MAAPPCHDNGNRLVRDPSRALSSYRQTRQLPATSRYIIDSVFGRADFGNDHSDAEDRVHTTGIKSDDPKIEFARCFLRLANLRSFALDRLSRYEATLWRQVGRILFALHALDRRKPQERIRSFSLGS